MKDILKEFENQEKKGILVVVSGPTCCGKDAAMRQLLKKNKRMIRLVTTNSRPKRGEEKEGADYYFVSMEKFEDLIAQEAFFEWVEYRGHYRGTQKKHIRKALITGKDVFWRIDVRGAKNIYRKVKKEVSHSAFIFIGERLSVLEARMIKRATEDKKGKKWSKARNKWELAQFRGFDYLVRNQQGKLKKTVEMVEAIIEAERRKVNK